MVKGLSILYLLRYIWHKEIDVTINVTREHIAKGKPFSTRFCPVALAVKEIASERMEVETSSVGVVTSTFSVYFVHYTEKEVFRYHIPLPYDAEKFILDFDNRKPVYPFSFDIEIPIKELKTDMMQ